MQLLSPAKDEGWRNYGTERQVQTPFAPPQPAQSKLGLPCLPGWSCRQGARAREFQQKVEVGHCSGWKQQCGGDLEGIIGQWGILGLQQGSLVRVEVGGGPGPRAGSISGARCV